jgi:L(+)-tartrate dehydratase beta subunit
VRKLGPGKYEKVCIGTTTSARMNRFTRGLLQDYGVRAIIGKGGLLADSIPVLQEFGGVYFAITGGAAALETTQIEEIEDVEFEELLPECLWKFRVRDFGPLVVAIDSHGHSLYEDVKSKARERLAELVARL